MAAKAVRPSPDRLMRRTTKQRRTKVPGESGLWVEPPIGIEPMTYALRGARALATHALAAPIARAIAPAALAALGLSGHPVHEPVHARRPHGPIILLLCVTSLRAAPRPQADPAVMGMAVYRLPAREYRTANCGITNSLPPIER